MKSLAQRITRVVVTAVVLAAAVGAAADSGTSAGKGGKFEKLPTARGTVTAVGNGTLSVATGEADRPAALSFAVDESTIVLKARKRIAVSELQVGDPITVAYVEGGGKAQAKRIWVRSPAPERMSAPGKKATAR